jgi:tetratricopeptide (TPR) repeat protein
MNGLQKTLAEAVRLHEQGHIDDAIKLYTKIQRVHRKDGQLLYLLGTAYHQIGQRKTAIECLDRAVQVSPNNAAAHNNRGNVLSDLGRLTDALASFDKAIALDSGYADAFNNRGNVLYKLERHAEARADYGRAIACRPGYAKAYFNRGVTFEALKRSDDALADYDKAIALKSDYADPHNNRGSVLNSLARHDEALASCDKAIALKPAMAQAHYNRGIALEALGRSQAALASFDKALALDPGYAIAHNARGFLLESANRLDEALACFDRAIASRPDYAAAYWNKALLLILMERYQEGWELYEWRFKHEEMKAYYHSFPQPGWRGGECLVDKRVLVYAEQGLGDTIQFCRYLPKLTALGAELVFEVPPALVSVVASLDCRMTVVAAGTERPPFDLHCPLMSLPLAFQTSVATIPADIPYLSCDKTKLDVWLGRLGSKRGPRVGLVWSGSATHKKDAARSVALERLTPLARLPVELHSLQKEYRSSDIETLTEGFPLRRHDDEFGDFSDTAALIAAMDVVISVDTSVAHLAGAMGKRVWILLPFAPDFRWGMERADTPWYPSARLFRQPAAGDWESVIEALVTSLRDLIAADPRA